jgi:hypothetical protein
MPSKCKYPDCNKESNYNFPDEKARLYCKAHAKPGMVVKKVDHRICIHPDHTGETKIPRASFNFEGETRPKYCKTHSEPGMVNLNNVTNKCDICKLKQPSFGLPGQKATRCATCRSKDMIDVVSNLCTFTYGHVGEKATRCKKHAEETMLDVKNQKCELCFKQPTFGFLKPTHCIDHKVEGMLDKKHTTSICKEVGCRTRATFGINIPTHCLAHKKEDMKDVVSSKCKKCGEIQGVFGIEKSELYCKACSTKEMKNLSAKMCEKCGEHQPTYNYKGVKPPKFCAGCALKDMVDVINPMCESCGLFMVCKKPHLCAYCKPVTTLKQKTKEMLVVNYLKEQGYEFVHNKSVGFVYGNYRPDIKICMKDYLIIVEIDEDQHRGYDQRCEIARMFNIAQAEDSKCIFIRYNPDIFHVDGKVKRVHTDTRLKILVENIEKCLTEPPEETINVFRLFYDNATGDYLSKYDLESKYKTIFDSI